MANRGIAAAVIVLGIALAGCSGSSSSEPTETAPVSFDASVTFQLLNERGNGFGEFTRLIDPDVSETACQGIGPFAYMIEGAAVTIEDASGETVALARLPIGEDTRNGSARPIECTYVVTFQAVPVSGFYTVAVDGGGSIEVTETELRDGLVIALPPETL